MKNVSFGAIRVFALCALFGGLKLSAQSVNGNIHLNSLGFNIEQYKTATVLCPNGLENGDMHFSVINAKNGKEVISGSLSDSELYQLTNQNIRKADFSELNKAGNYFIRVDGIGESEVFPVGKSVYKEPFITAMRSFYLWRCGMAVETDYNGEHYVTEACHLEDGWQKYRGLEGQVDGTGGWHDAGDYGKYTINAGVTMASLFMAWEHFRPSLEKMDLSLPETAPGYPQYLKELKWEMDFLFKMVYPDGSGKVSHKLTRLNFSGYIMPQEDKEERYFTDWSSEATANFAATAAHAYRVFIEFDKEYAKNCLDAARLSYDCVKREPGHSFRQGDFLTGGYLTGYNDDIIWASAELWESTGEKKYLDDLENAIRGRRSLVADDWDWGDVTNLALYVYALSQRDGRDATLLNSVKQSVVKSAQNLVSNSQKDPYGRAMSRYYWGCNGTMCRQAINLHVADMIQPDAEYQKTILKILAHTFSDNYYNRSYVTGLGLNPPLHPHDRRSIADGIDAPWPGYLVGGGHSATDWVDEQEDYERNEIAINWQAALVYLLAAVQK